MEKIDTLIEMVANIAQEISAIRGEMSQNSREIELLKKELTETQKMVYSNSACLEHIEQQLCTVIEQVAGLTEFRNEVSLQINKLNATWPNMAPTFGY